MSFESILGAIAVLAVVIFVHELGHFLVAKWCDVEVLVFSMGFGPTIYSRTVGETEYRLAAIPFGGYVRMAGQDDTEDPPASDPSRGFSAKTLGQRAAIVAAGPAVNIVFAFLVFAAALFFYGTQAPTERALIGAVLPGSPADVAGLEAGDTIVAIDGETVTEWVPFAETVRSSDGRTLQVTVAGESGEERTLAITPEPRPERDKFGEIVGQAYMIGIQRGLVREPVGFFESFRLAGWFTWEFSSMIFQTLARVFQGRVDASDLGGPIMIAQEAGRLAATGFEPLLRFIGIISINLGIINILPIPVLDGGHLFFFMIEALRGRPLSVRVREGAQQVGVFMLLALMAFVVFNDISRIWNG
jgi:regulator of sigma E protease